MTLFPSKLSRSSAVLNINFPTHHPLIINNIWVNMIIIEPEKENVFTNKPNMLSRPSGVSLHLQIQVHGKCVLECE